MNVILEITPSFYPQLYQDRPLNFIKTDTLIQFAYTGHRTSAISQNWIHSVINTTVNITRNKLVSMLGEFEERGLFCNMAWCDVTGGIKPALAFLMSLKYGFISQYIRTGSISRVMVSHSTSAGENSEQNVLNTEHAEWNYWALERAVTTLA